MIGTLRAIALAIIWPKISSCPTEGRFKNFLSELFTRLLILGIGIAIGVGSAPFLPIPPHSPYDKVLLKGYLPPTHYLKKDQR